MKRHFVLISIVFFTLSFISTFLYGKDEKMRNIRDFDPGVKTKDVQFKGVVKPDLNFGNFPLYFIANKGQANKWAKFYAKASRYTLWLTKEGLVFDSVKQVEIKVEAEEGRQTTDDKPQMTDYSPHSPKLERNVSRLIFLNAKKNPVIVPIEESTLKVNYFIGNDPSKWYCDVPTSKAVFYKNLYKSIDLKVYGIEKQIEYDWMVKPGGNPGDIMFEYKNVKGTRLDKEGNLLIETDFGELMHKKPVSYQEIGRERQDVNVMFKKINGNTYGFKVGAYDRSRELIIDPVVLAYSTYLGGGNSDTGLDIAVDNSGYAYVTGTTQSTDYPTHNQYQLDQNGYDAFVTKIDTTEKGVSSLIYSTYLGGGWHEYVTGIAVDSSGNAYVTGDTGSADFPTLNPYQTYQKDFDVFVTRIDTTRDGISSLVYSTLLGGAESDRSSGIAVDNSGNAYITGETLSTDFPTLNSYQTHQGRYDAFVAKIDTTRKGEASLIYSTYLGGTGNDYGKAIAVDINGKVYVAGNTYGNDFPTLNEYQTFQSVRDAFVSKIDTTKKGVSSLIYSTYLGGERFDYAADIAVDNTGNVYVIGETLSENFPILGQYQTHQADFDAFITKIDTTQKGTSCLIYSTYLGGERWDNGYGIALDNSNNVYVTGHTYSTDFPTLNPFQTDQGGGDAFIARIDTTRDGVLSLVYSTYLGGGEYDSSRGIGVDNNGNVYVTGYTYSTDFPTLNPYQAHQGIIDAFVAKLLYTAGPATVTTTEVSSVTATSASSGGTVISDGGAPVTARGVCWSTFPNPTILDNYTTDGTDTGSFTSVITDLTPNTTYYVRAYAVNSAGTAYGDEVIFTTSQLLVSVRITKPRDGDTVSGDVIIRADADPIESVTDIEFYIDGGLLYRDKRFPYQTRWNTTGFSNGNHTIAAKAYYSWGQTTQHEITVKVCNANEPPYIQLNRRWLNFGVVNGDSQTGSQGFLISNSGGGTLNWTASVSDNWIQISPLSGTAEMMVTVSMDAAGLTPGSYIGAITITDSNADNSPAVLYIYLEFIKKAQEMPPFGSFDSPMDGAVVSGSIPITGWALDDVEVSKVKIFRNPLESHDTGLIYIGDAEFVEDARPDVEGKYSNFPKHHRAGWGYTMLTNLLPNEGNGTFIITAVAADSSGNEVTLGEKSIICDNANAVNPFGAIDTPTQGGDASGTGFINFGWALTPKPNTIPKNGSTIKVWVDGVPLEGNPVYNRYREDVARLFPGYNNSDGAGGYYYLDTTLYPNGVHTIAWSVIDDAGNTSGIGSRYFNVMNVNNPAATSFSTFSHGHRYRDKFSIEHLPIAASPVYLKKGYKASNEQNQCFPGSNGIIKVEIKEGERIEIQNTSSRYYSGYMVVGDQLKPLPVGSFLDPRGRKFYWQPGVGFIGEYRLVFIEQNQTGEFKKIQVKVIIHPGH